MELIEEIQIKEKDTIHTEKKLKNMYETAFPLVAGFISKMGGNFEEAKDIFHDALIVYLEIMSEKPEKITTSARAYILGIAKHLWIKKYNLSRTYISLDQFEAAISVPEDFYPTVDNKRLLRFLELAGKKCLELLHAFYYQKISVKRLAGKLGYSNEHSASVQKYKCLEKVRHFVKEKSLNYEDFIEKHPFN